MQETMTAEQHAAIVAAITAGIRAGADYTDWDAPEFEEARRLTGEAGCVWDFEDWRSTRYSLEFGGGLGGVRVVEGGDD